MVLQEFNTISQTLCHDGYAQHDFLFEDKNGNQFRPEDLKIVFKSDATEDGFIKVKLGEK